MFGVRVNKTTRPFMVEEYIFARNYPIILLVLNLI